MIKKLLCLVLSLSLLAALTGCGKEPEEPALQEAVTVPTAPAPTACPHEWVEATHFYPQTCILCGETEGEPLEDYFTYNDLELELPHMFKFPMLLFQPIDPDAEPTAENVAHYKNAPCTVTFDPVSVEYPGDGTQFIEFTCHLNGDMEIDTDGRVYEYITYRWGFYDFYTGACFNNLSDLDEELRTGVLNLDGLEVPFAFIRDSNMNLGEPVYRDDGRVTMHYTNDVNFSLTFPEDYDGLVFAIEPMFEPEPEGFQEATGLVYPLDHDIYEESRFFLIQP